MPNYLQRLLTSEFIPAELKHDLALNIASIRTMRAHLTSLGAVLTIHCVTKDGKEEIHTVEFTDYNKKTRKETRDGLLNGL